MFFGDVEIDVIWLQMGPAGVLELGAGVGEVPSEQLGLSGAV